MKRKYTKNWMYKAEKRSRNGRIKVSKLQRVLREDFRHIYNEMLKIEMKKKVSKSEKLRREGLEGAMLAIGGIREYLDLWCENPYYKEGGLK